MIFLVFKIGSDRYVVEAKKVVEIVPMVNLKQLPGSASHVLGLMNYRGLPVPVIDLGRFSQEKNAEKNMSTRIIVLNHFDEKNNPFTIGVVAEDVTETIDRDLSQFVKSAASDSGDTLLGSVTIDGDEIIQMVDVSNLLSPDVTKNMLSMLDREKSMLKVS
ncbi:MAG: chemotaxis protein CheW [Gammaproteobacteria bacterium]